LLNEELRCECSEGRAARDENCKHEKKKINNVKLLKRSALAPSVTTTQN
jgi:hypothetical protein